MIYQYLSDIVVVCLQCHLETPRRVHVSTGFNEIFHKLGVSILAQKVQWSSVSDRGFNRNIQFWFKLEEVLAQSVVSLCQDMSAMFDNVVSTEI